MSLEVAYTYKTARKLARTNEFLLHRVYLGHESCEKMMPDKEDLKQQLEYCQERHWPISFFTPYIFDDRKTDYYLSIFEGLNRLSQSEVIVNNLGMLQIYIENPDYHNIKLVLGRSMIHQWGDPRIDNFITQYQYYLDAEVINTLFEISADQQEMYNFFREYKITAVEINNFPQQLSLGNFNYHMHLDYMPISRGHICQTSLLLGYDGLHCNEECLTSHLMINHVFLGDLVLNGNTIYKYTGNQIPPNTINKIKRIIYHPGCN